MADLLLDCIVKGESKSFPVNIKLTNTVGQLKKDIKAEKANAFSEIDADKLTLWLIQGGATKNELPTAPLKELDDELEDLQTHFPNGAQKNRIYIVIQPLQQELKRGLECESETSRKVSRIDNWIEYRAKDGLIDLPPVLIKLLNTKEFTPAPREEFKLHLDDKHAGDEITLPSLGQEPKHYGQDYQGRCFFITEQMERMWEEFSANSTHSIKRVLSGPIGVGKSYLAFFLAAKAYAEGWLVLYISDASVLVNEKASSSAIEICKRFFALNKDILTTADLEEMAAGRPTEEDVATCATTEILRHLLCQKDRKTLFIIDERGALFHNNNPKPNLLTPLIKLTDWAQDRNGARVVFTGTAHAGYERQYITSDILHWVEFVTPLSDFIFDKLLAMVPTLARVTIKGEVKRITNNVPRELVKLATLLVDNHGTVLLIWQTTPFWKQSTNST
ncbi:hypothetical protein BGX26_005177 [Mortierella sp. AD094]|nr:hypothetical protein BGX26_005177 [Mortierella sp. AD094]